MEKGFQLDLTVRLIKKELPKSENSEAGLRRAKYFVQYLSVDGYVLSTHEASQNEKDDLLKIHHSLSGNIPEHLL